MPRYASFDEAPLDWLGDMALAQRQVSQSERTMLAKMIAAELAPILAGRI